ncbi:uncharacterized protein LOC126846160 [Adelges cooleyi]|uniref:uncharacterized protein LOC126846160 n=1 Tax=Adelges cooleyi TaxID=133065 RepID=UPI00218002C1|nr:uncharacterized protein LOC126846160 [Adelges cooleyi]
MYKTAKLLTPHLSKITNVRHSTCAPIAINGFGRIGKCLLRLAMEKDINVVAINQPFFDNKQIASSFQNDTVHGPYDGKIDVQDKCIVVNGKTIDIFHETKPEDIKWKDASASYVLEASGQFTTVELAKKHISAGAKKVVITTPSKDAPMFVKGVNFDNYCKSMEVVSNASCTTNCAAPLIKILHDKFCVKSGLLTTVHALTASQTILDALKNRSGPGNAVPSTTGAAKAVGIVIPELLGKIQGDAVRVPTLDVSLLKLFVNVKKDASVDEIKKEIVDQAEGCMSDVVYYNEGRNVSADYIGCQFSAIVDFNQINVIDKFVTIGAWYDNEMGYASRVLDLVRHMIEKDGQ